MTRYRSRSSRRRCAGGYDPVGDPPDVFQKNFIRDLKRWGDMARLAKVEAE
jgi:hypothetical protein